MRFVAAIVSFVIAFGLIGLGIAQRTVFAEPDRVTSEVTVTDASDFETELRVIASATGSLPSAAPSSPTPSQRPRR